MPRDAQYSGGTSIRTWFFLVKYSSFRSIYMSIRMEAEGADCPWQCLFNDFCPLPAFLREGQRFWSIWKCSFGQFVGTKTLYGHSSLSSLSSLSSFSSPSSFSFPSSFSSLSSWIVISAPHLYSNIYKTFLDDSNFWMKSEDGLGFYMDMNYLCNYCGNVNVQMESHQSH